MAIGDKLDEIQGKIEKENKNSIWSETRPTQKGASSRHALHRTTISMRVYHTLYGGE